MKLLVSDPLGHSPYTSVAETPTPEEIEQLVRSLEWQQLTGVKVELDAGRFFEFTGSLNDDFSIVYGDGEEIWITKNPVKNLDQGLLALQSYAMGEGDWKNLLEWNHLTSEKEYNKPQTSGCAALIVVVLGLSITMLWFVKDFVEINS